MRALKVLVVVMGVLLVAGVAIVIITIMTRLTQHPAATAPVATADGRPTPFGTAALSLPAGARVIDMQSAGRRLALRLRRADGSEAILIVDPDTGTALGTIELKPEN